MFRRSFLQKLAAAGLGLLASPFAFSRTGKRVHRIAFGSCAVQTDPQPIWDAIGRTAPDVFAFLGDNVYADTEDMAHMAAQYDLLGRSAPFARFRRRVPIIATWDDHDYGLNDSGAEYPMKEASKRVMLSFFREPANSPRWRRPGIYHSYFIGEAPRRIQIILLDLRWFRTPLIGEGGYYRPNPDPAATMLGAQQWAWLEDQLRQPADLRFIGSSIQFTPPDHGWEKWENYPADKRRLISLIDALGLKNLFVLSGDMHYAEISAERTPGGIVIHEFTSSGLNYAETAEGIPNARRLALLEGTPSFGLVTVDWDRRGLTFEARDVTGRPRLSKTVRF